MPTPSHSPEWHLLDSRFADANRGLVPPARNLSAGGAALRIENLDRADPPGYQPGDVPRGKFNANVFSLTAAPAMPRIPVVCSVTGFDPAQTPIEWRLVCRHVLCRHTNVTRFRYSGASESFEREWRGRSASARFELFDGPCSYSDAGRVLGGHALLMAAVALPQARLLDYVHVRIAGANPTPAEVLGHLDARLAGYDPNIVRMARAVFSQESNFRQFAAGAQSSALMRFTRVHHADALQPDCAVRFDWPDDPPGFPLASFDFGVGISQWTRVGQQRVSADIAWDWRENIRLGVNLLLGAVGRALKPGRSWREVARVAWTAYNGTGAAAAAYATRLAASPDGRAISSAPAPSAAKAQVALLAAPAPLPEPEPWAYA